MYGFALMPNAFFFTKTVIMKMYRTEFFSFLRRTTQKLFHFLQKFIFLRKYSAECEKGYRWKDLPLICSPAYSFILFCSTLLCTAFEKICGGII